MGLEEKGGMKKVGLEEKVESKGVRCWKVVVVKLGLEGKDGAIRTFEKDRVGLKEEGGVKRVGVGE